MQSSSLLLFLVAGCVTPPDRDAFARSAEELDKLLRNLRAERRYVEAMRVLPEVMEAYARYTAKTGEPLEGAAGQVFAATLSEIATKGGTQWQVILDDPAIPYTLKSELALEILETQLKGGIIPDEMGRYFLLPGQKP